jgi:hypothetical protein
MNIDFPKMGYNIYRGKIYTDKFLLFQDTILNQDYDPKIEFWFHDDVFEKIDTTVEPNFDISTLYKLRAQQIREEYDKVILSYSGGADCHQILMTFLNNGIFIDEIHTVAAEKLTSKIPVINDPNHPYGFYFEHELAAKPGLALAAKLSPNTQIKIFDYSDKIKSFYQENFIMDNLDLMTPSRFFDRNHSTTLRAMFCVEYLQDYMDNYGGKAAVIVGSEKPNLYINHDTVFLGFADDIRSGSKHQTKKSKLNNYELVMFYWSREAPLIPIKQAHLMKKYLQANPSFAKYRNDTPKWFNTLNKVIYPNWDGSIYQKYKKMEDEQIIRDLLPEIDLDRFYQFEKEYFMNNYSKLKIYSNDTYPSLRKSTIYSKFYKIGKYYDIR